MRITSSARSALLATGSRVHNPAPVRARPPEGRVDGSALRLCALMGLVLTTRCRGGMQTFDYRFEARVRRFGPYRRSGLEDESS